MTIADVICRRCGPVKVEVGSIYVLAYQDNTNGIYMVDCPACEQLLVWPIGPEFVHSLATAGAVMIRRSTDDVPSLPRRADLDITYGIHVPGKIGFWQLLKADLVSLFRDDTPIRN